LGATLLDVIAFGLNNADRMRLELGHQLAGDVPPEILRDYLEEEDEYI
jgi:hypothetical protein